MSGYDMDGDGIIDSILQDSYGDGVADVMAFDTDQNGVFEVALVDTNNDSLVDTYVYDENQNGIPDAVFVDGNEDGYLERTIRDSNENGLDDATETYPSTGTIGGSSYGDMTIVAGDTNVAGVGPSWGTISGSTNTTGNAEVDAMAREANSNLVDTGLRRNPDIDGDSYPNGSDHSPNERTRH